MKTYPVAELFDSIQGEGTYAGTPMYFIRLAGCNVGIYADPHPDFPFFELMKENPNFSVCQAVIGSSFLCDTNYKAHDKYSLEAIMKDIPKGAHVCITGGEPFIHDLTPLQIALGDRGCKIHYETSGTKPIKVQLSDWVTCSPKVGFIQENVPFVNAFKFLVDASQSAVEWEEQIAAFLQNNFVNARTPVFIQGIADIDTLNPENMKRAMEVVMLRTNGWKTCIQLHKVLKVR